MIKNIVFDYGGVLVDWDSHYFYDYYFSQQQAREVFVRNTGRRGLSAKEMSDWFLDNICTQEWNAEFDAGGELDAVTNERVALFPEWDAPIRAYMTNWEPMMHGAVDGMLEVVQDLKKQGYRLYGLSNWSSYTFNAFVRNTYPVFALLDGMVISGDEKCIKPDEKIYRILLDRYHLAPAETLFIDDNAANVAGAERLGINAIIFKDAKTLREELKTILK